MAQVVPLNLERRSIDGRFPTNCLNDGVFRAVLPFTVEGDLYAVRLRYDKAFTLADRKWAPYLESDYDFQDSKGNPMWTLRSA